jgi:hypothetical protein
MRSLNTPPVQIRHPRHEKHSEMGAFAVLEPYWLVFFEYFCFLKLTFYFRVLAFLFSEQVLSMDLIKFGRYFKLFTNPNVNL